MNRQQISFAALGLMCAALSIVGLREWLTAFEADPFQDWAVFHAAAAGYLHYGSWQAILAHWPLAGHPWLYPPSFLLLLLPFGLLGFGLGCAVFLLSTFLALIVAIWKSSRRWRAFCLLATILSPAAIQNFYLGQNAFFSGALLVGGVVMLERRPILAGVLLGIMTYKPQLALFVPVALVATRNWKAMGSAAVTAVLLVFISGLAFGFDAWRAWIAMIAGTGPLAPSVLAGRLPGASVFTCAILFGATPLLANALQAVAILIGTIAVYWSWRAPLREELRFAMLFAATIFAAPHVTGYDAILIAFAGSLLFATGLEYGFQPGEQIVALIAWAFPLLTPPMFHPTGRLTPFFTALTIFAVMMRGIRTPPNRPSFHCREVSAH